MPQRLVTAPALLLAICGLLLVGEAPRGAEAERWPTDGWRTGTPESQGVDSAALAEAMELVVQKQLPLHGLLIVRHGVLVFESYVYPYRPDVPHDVASVTKSVTSILTGIAIDKGHLPSVTASVIPLLKLARPPEPEPRRDAMTHRAPAHHDVRPPLWRYAWGARAVRDAAGARLDRLCRATADARRSGKPVCVLQRQ